MARRLLGPFGEWPGDTPGTGRPGPPPPGRDGPPDVIQGEIVDD